MGEAMSMHSHTAPFFLSMSSKITTWCTGWEKCYLNTFVLSIFFSLLQAKWKELNALNFCFPVKQSPVSLLKFSGPSLRAGSTSKALAQHFFAIQQCIFLENTHENFYWCDNLKKTVQFKNSFGCWVVLSLYTLNCIICFEYRARLHFLQYFACREREELQNDIKTRINE